MYSSSHASRQRFSRSPRHDVHKGYQLLEPRQLLAGDVCFHGELMWSDVPDTFVRGVGDQTHVRATRMELFDLAENSIRGLLDEAPIESPGVVTADPVTLSIPNPDGIFERFAIVESPILEPELSAKFSDIKTYRGQGIDNPSSTIRLDYTDHGFHAQVLAADNGDYYIDPLIHRQTDVYASYFVRDSLAQPNSDFVEVGIDTEHLPDYGMDAEAILSVAKGHELMSHDDGPCTCPMCAAAKAIRAQNGSNAETGSSTKDGSGDSRIAPDFGDELRTYRLAVAATGEYTQFHGGSVSEGMSAIVTTMNRVNGIYENDLAIRMVLVANNDQLIYTNGNTDPYTNNSGGAMLGENQSNIDSVIGNANYDIGHVFSTGGGGIAGLGVVGVTGAKARGVTGLGSPIGDPFDVDYVAHEMGHQFDGNHTFNGDSGSCAGGNRNGSTAFEPGSGASIQAYAGICGNDNLQSNSDAMFHSLSIDEIRAYVTTGAGNAAATITSTGNNIPTVDAGPSFTIPSGTPFELTAVGSDPDGDDQLTYSWEQRDLGPQQDVNGGDNGSSPIFRTFDPTVEATRTFPRIGDLLNNTTVVGETLPTTDRTMNFRVVLRDNSSGGGGVVSDDTTVNVNPTGSSFEVTSQNGSTTWLGDSQQTITWNVAGTDSNGIDTADVDILLASDGIDYNMVLATDVPNDGSHDITVPNIDTTTARIKVKGSGNIFFDINNSNIEIQRSGAGVLLIQSDGSTVVSESGATDSYELALGTVPAGDVTISATADDQSELSLDGSNYSTSISFTLADTTPEEIFVRAIDDSNEEGSHSSTISHEITATDDPDDYPTSTPIGDVIATVLDDDLIEPLVVGIDFDVAAGNGPSNWSSIGTGSNATFSNLGSESGLATGFDLTITESGGGWTEFAVTPNASTIPQHGVSLTNIDGQIFTAGDAIELVWSDLNPLLDYEIYVFGLEGFFDTIEQNVTVTGDTSTSFEQRFNQNELFINDQIGDSSRTLSEYALVVGADASGEIRIQIDPIAGTDDVVLGGVAITELPNEAPSDILLSNDEIAENTDTSAGAVEVGLLSAIDADSDAFTYSLVSGSGDADNDLFEISGDSLRIKQGTVIDFETASSYSIRVEVSDGINTYQESLTISVVDQAESSTLIVGDGTTQRSMLTNLQLEFDGIVTLGATPFELLKRGSGGGLVDVIAMIDNSSGNSVVTLTFSGSFVESSGSLEDGNYQLTMFGDQIQTLSGMDFDADGDGTAGGNFVFGDTETDNFYRLFGDGSGNRMVDIFDLLSFRETWLSGEGDAEFDVRFDSNLDGNIDIFDLLRFRQNWLESMDFE
jgi:hypothetical protein